MADEETVLGEEDIAKLDNASLSKSNKIKKNRARRRRRRSLGTDYWCAIVEAAE